ncbi:hypothetical protein CA830_34875, partial [Burkholderia multivorans]
MPTCAAALPLTRAAACNMRYSRCFARQEPSGEPLLERCRSATRALRAGRAARARTSRQAEHQRESLSAVAAR